jgi:hypothetical protein
MNKVTKVQQKKLYSRVFAKGYLDKLRDNTLNHLDERGYFKNSNDNHYYKTLLNHIYENTCGLVGSDYVIYNKLNETLNTTYITDVISSHKENIMKEKKRREEEARKKKAEEEVKLGF